MRPIGKIKYAGLAVGLFLFTGVHSGYAAGTPAGTLIKNQATVTYDVGDVTGLTASSNETVTTVAEILNVTVTWQDAPGVTVNPGDTDRILEFLVTNTGNGDEAFVLTAVSTIAGDDFDPSLVDIYFDDGDGTWEGKATETQYIPGINEPILAADDSIKIFVLNDIPESPADESEGLSRLVAAAATGTGSPGTSFSGQGADGVDAVVGSSGAQDEDTGRYVVSAISVDIQKSFSVSDPHGGDRPIPGAVVRYSIVVQVMGTGTAKNVEVTDGIPDTTTYIPNSLWLNSDTNLTDQAGDDAGEVSAGNVTVRLGDLSAESPMQTIVFEVSIN